MTISIVRSAVPNPAAAGESSIVLTITLSTDATVDSATYGGDSIQLGCELPTALYTSATNRYSINGGPFLGPYPIFSGQLRIGVGATWTTSETTVIEITLNGITSTDDTYVTTPRVESAAGVVYTPIQTNAYNIVVDPPPPIEIFARFVRYSSYAALDAALTGMTPEDQEIFLTALPTATSVAIGDRWLLYCVIKNSETILEDTPLEVIWGAGMGETFDTNGPYEQGPLYYFPADVPPGSTTVFLSDSEAGGDLIPGPLPAGNFWQFVMGDDDDVGDPTPDLPYSYVANITLYIRSIQQAILV